MHLSDALAAFALLAAISSSAQDPSPYRPEPSGGGVTTGMIKKVGSVSFHVEVPQGREGRPGLLLMLNSMEGPGVPFGWDEPIAEHNLIYLCPEPGDGLQTDGERIEQALAGLRSVAAEFQTDSARVYVGGFNEGGRLAARIAFEHPGLLRGAISFGAVHFPAKPDPRMAAGTTRFVLVTGETGPRREEMVDAFERGFLKSKLPVLLLDEPPQALASPAVMRRALEYLEAGP